MDSACDRNECMVARMSLVVRRFTQELELGGGQAVVDDEVQTGDEPVASVKHCPHVGPPQERCRNVGPARSVAVVEPREEPIAVQPERLVRPVIGSRQRSASDPRYLPRLSNIQPSSWRSSGFSMPSRNAPCSVYVSFVLLPSAAISTVASETEPRS
jgi:hypothetical protein